MKLLRIAFQLLLASGLGLSSLHGQEPELRPVATYTTAISDGDMSALRYFARRCAALYAIVSNQMREQDQIELGERYGQAGVIFLALAERAENEMGRSENPARQTTVRAVEGIAEVLLERMARNMALTGSYYVDDLLLSSDVSTCGEYATALSRRQ